MERIRTILMEEGLGLFVPMHIRGWVVGVFPHFYLLPMPWEYKFDVFAGEVWMTSQGELVTLCCLFGGRCLQTGRNSGIGFTHYCFLVHINCLDRIISQGHLTHCAKNLCESYSHLSISTVRKLFFHMLNFTYNPKTIR